MKFFKKINYVIFLFFSITYSCSSQVIDSLLSVLKTEKADTNRVKTLIDIGWEYSYSDVNKIEPVALEALTLSEKLKYEDGRAQAYNLLGVANRSLSNSDKAIEYFNKTLEIRKQLNQVEKQAKVNINIANVYQDKADYSKAEQYYKLAIEEARQVKKIDVEMFALTNLAAVYQSIGDYSKALDCLFTALQQNKTFKDEIQEASIDVNIAVIYQEQNQLEKAIEYNLKALELFKKNNRDDSVALIYNNLGIIYREQHLYDQSIKNYKDALRLYEKLGISTSYNMVLHNLGVLLFDMKQYDKALEYQNTTLEAALKNNDEYSAALSMMSIADIFDAQKKFKEAETIALRGLAIVEKEGDKDEMKNCYSTLAGIYSHSNNFKDAFIYQQKLQNIYEEINNNEVNKRIGQMQAMYEADKKQKAIELLTKDNEIQNERIIRQNIVNYAAVAGIILVLILAFMMFKRYREKQKANVEITHQKELIEVKNKEILDSIYYARRIQRALLASDNLLKKNLPDYFVLYKPKDIVSGDFYWAQNTPDNKFLLATCDCTGHGVPGAFMSLLNISKLTETVNEKKITQPDLVFSHVREEIIKALSSDGNEQSARDGMDAVCCSYDFNKMQVQFAAANNPVIVVRNNEIIEYKADKFPVGLHQGELISFTLQTIDLHKGDCIYTFTDGYSDQFGGDKGKKLMSKKFKEILASSAGKPMGMQKKELEDHFNNWRGGIEQVDDVLVIGIRV